MPPSGYQKPETQFIKRQIVEILLKHAGISNTNAVFILRNDEDLAVERKGVVSELPKDATLGNYVTEMRKKLRSSKYERPWSVAASSDRTKEHYIEPNALPVVLGVWRVAISFGQTLTLRQARWAAYLRFAVIEEYSATSTDEMFELWSLATQYAANEVASEKQDGSEAALSATEASQALDLKLAFRLMRFNSRTDVALGKLLLRCLDEVGYLPNVLWHGDQDDLEGSLNGQASENDGNSNESIASSAEMRDLEDRWHKDPRRELKEVLLGLAQVLFTRVAVPGSSKGGEYKAMLRESKVALLDDNYTAFLRLFSLDSDSQQERIGSK